MRILTYVLLGIAAALALFAYWGIGTSGGSRAFDEMAGMIPFLAGLLAAVLCLAAAGIWVIGRMR